MSHLASFQLSDMVRASAGLRETGRSASTLRDVAERVVDYLYEDLCSPESGRPDTVLVRFYKTHRLDQLPPRLQDVARAPSGGSIEDRTRCLTLFASRGLEPAWNSPSTSAQHQAIALSDEDAVRGAPMIAQLVHQFGLDIADVVAPDPALLLELNEKTYNVFHVAAAEGSPFVPAQDFVRQYAVASALGFGGVLSSGDLFAVVLFSRVAISVDVAARFRPLALSVKAALDPFVDGPFWDPAPAGDPSLRTAAHASSHPLEKLLEVHEAIALEQAITLEQSLARTEGFAAQLRNLATASIGINQQLTIDRVLALTTKFARDIIGAEQAIASRDVGSQTPENPPMRGWLAAPLVSRDGRNLGLLQLSDKSDGGDFTPEDEAILVQLAQLASVSIEKSSAYEREHAVAAALQRSLLPGRLPDVEGLEIAARSHAGVDGVDVGGDWYDAFDVAQGDVALLLGDVAGRGLPAAVVMGQLRTATRAYAVEDTRPTSVVTRLDRFIQSAALVDFATLAYALWQRSTGALHVVLAGHPPPLLIAVDGSCRFLDLAPGLPLGYSDAGYWEDESTVFLKPGETLLLYSDGLIEANDLSLDEGMARLVELVTEAPMELEALASHIVGKVLATGVEDDVTLLALRRR